MVSDKSFLPLFWAFQLGHFLKMCPGFWNEGTDSVGVDYGKKYFFPFLSRKYYFTPRKIIPVTLIVIQSANLLYILIFLIFAEHAKKDIYLALMIFAITYLGFSAQLNILLCIDNFCKEMNAFFVLNQRYRK